MGSKRSSSGRTFSNETLREAIGEFEWYMASAPGDRFNPSFAEVEAAIEAMRFVLHLRELMGVDGE